MKKIIPFLLLALFSFNAAAQSGPLVAGTITRANNADTYPIVLGNNLGGGMKSVTTASALAALININQYDLATTQDTGIIYQCQTVTGSSPVTCSSWTQLPASAIPNAPANVATVAALRALTSAFTQTAVQVADPSRGGLFVLNTADTSGAVFTGSITSNVLTVTAVANGTLAAGQQIACGVCGQNVWISALGTGTGGTGTYNLVGSVNVTSQTITSDNGVLTYVAQGGQRFERKYGSEVEVAWGGVTGNPSGDDTTNLNYTFKFTCPNGLVAHMPAWTQAYGISTVYNVSSGVTCQAGSGGGIDMDASQGGGTQYGSIITTCTSCVGLTVTGEPKVMNVVVGGQGQVAQGVLYNNTIVANIGITRCYNFAGTCIEFRQINDSLVGPTSAQNCGSAAAYCILVSDGAGTSNETVFNRIQAELCTTLCIYVSPNSLNLHFSGIHSERATPTASTITWQLGGQTSTYDTVELTAIGTPGNATALIEGADTLYNTLQTLPNFPVELSSTTGYSISLINPQIQGTLTNVSNQTGLLSIRDGAVNNFTPVAGGSWKFFGTQITTATLQGESSNPFLVRFTNLEIGTTVSGGSGSAATFDDVIQDNAGNLLAGYEIVNGGEIISSTINPISGATINLNNVVVTGNYIQTNTNVNLNCTGHTEFIGNLEDTSGSDSSIFDPGCFATGTISGFGQPNAGTFYGGQYTKNFAAASGQPSGWVYKAAGGWTPLANIP